MDHQLPNSLAPDGPTDQTPCQGPDAGGCTDKELDQLDEHNERLSSISLQAREKVTRWMRDRIGYGRFFD
ncbi:hypothetical protein BHE90_014690 [Fusarium euwallaceae]|uniref:Uncharacterized protein n=5 Tax=Fusarium solani species complex TaxID=232080 RepID=A0A3M2RIB9_9HYPO|nr:hypothetical protein CDV36_014252 [Fusarium kuroshium]RSL83782.1 hypothetical protein CEP51_004318 [Fusarium floridanum]RSL85365.1 hypothetical protein CEP52_016169 [Fusarium oligoseptatum]RSL97470.1 hypothetical protein CDV31_013022 [Fusarium ambrosium]RTE70924.1 hypothetical protein BHE90_014690 [Fusarium euwallaceae]